jgi:arginase family enzyme
MAIHFNLDNAWPAGAIPFGTLDVTTWGPQLRFSAPARLIEKFCREAQKELAPFVLYGSGDFHHLTALWVRQVAEPVVLVSFDHHPDWDIRPPRWCCGSWVNRALELPRVQKVYVWGSGQSKSWWTDRLFGNRRAEREGRLEINRLLKGHSRPEQDGRGAIVPANWRERFSAFVRVLGDSNLYVTIDLDCMRAEGRRH